MALGVMILFIPNYIFYTFSVKVSFTLEFFIGPSRKNTAIIAFRVEWSMQTMC